MEPIPDPVTGFDELKEEMRIRESVKRAQFSIPLQLGEGLSIGVKGYVLLSCASKQILNHGVFGARHEQLQLGYGDAARSNQEIC